MTAGCGGDFGRLAFGVHLIGNDARGNELAGDLDGIGHIAARVSSEVQDDIVLAGGQGRRESQVELGAGGFVHAGYVDVGDGPVGQRSDLDFRLAVHLAHYRLLDRLRATQQPERHRSAFLALDEGCGLVEREAVQ